MLNSIRGSELCPVLVRVVYLADLNESLSPSELAHRRLLAGADALACRVAAADVKKRGILCEFEQPPVKRVVSCCSFTSANNDTGVYSDALFLLSWFHAHAK
jgi:hypothetical protein